jgi:hypothetical protein
VPLYLVTDEWLLLSPADGQCPPLGATFVYCQRRVWQSDPFSECGGSLRFTLECNACFQDEFHSLHSTYGLSIDFLCGVGGSPHWFRIANGVANDIPSQCGPGAPPDCVSYMPSCRPMNLRFHVSPAANSGDCYAAYRNEIDCELVFEGLLTE